MSEYEKKLVADLRRDARKIGVWSEVREDMINAADLIEKLCAERDSLLDALCDNEFQTFVPLDEVSGVIDAIPAADVQEVRHGYWFTDYAR